MMIDLARETRLVTALKASLYAAALTFYLAPLSSWWGVGAAAVGMALGIGLASLVRRWRLRIPVALAGAAGLLLTAALLGRWVLDAESPSAVLGIRGSFATSDIVTFGLGALALIFTLRLLAGWRRTFSLLEVVFISGSVVVLLMDHRNRMIHRPRIFSDWVWTVGLDPGTVLAAVGVVLCVASIQLFLRGQRLLKLASTLLLLLALAVGYYLLRDDRVPAKHPQDSLGLSGKGKGKGGGGGAGSKNPFKDNYNNKSPPTPVAIALLRDDFAPRNNVMYFRQSVLSLYNGHHLVPGRDRGHDRDVIAEYPRSGPVLAAAGQSKADHEVIPTTMYLLVDHPQPLGLAHPLSYALVNNPNPQQFVAAYDVKSRVLSVPTQRLLGRRSVPPSWTAVQRTNYLSLPDDPRYQALADIIVRQAVDPRFANDDLARAYAIKRYLETKGFYTLRSKHSSRKDPTASFLFGSMRGYCVHFAHAAAFMLRSQGIASRVALGYAVQTSKRGGGSSVLIMNDRAHAWPEIHLEGIGWVTFDIYPERTDMPPPTPVDYDLEKLLGELARKDKTAGLRPDATPLKIPWRAVAQGSLGLLLGLLVLAYLIKLYRRLIPLARRGRAYPALAYRAVLDRLSDLGRHRRRGETRERHAARLAALTPHLDQLTNAHLARALGAPNRADRDDSQRFAALVLEVRNELSNNVHPAKRALAWLNPIGWMLTR